MDKRISRQTYYMQLAELTSWRSTCTRAKVGAVLVNPLTGRVVAMGYNGGVKGGIHCIDEGCLMYDDHCIRTIHAEVNCVANLEKSYDHLHLYCTHQPCLNCLKLLAAVNVKQIYYYYSYDSEARDLLYQELVRLTSTDITMERLIWK